MITDCQPDAERLAPLIPCIDTYDMGDANTEWPWNCLSRFTAAYSCGVLSRSDAAAVHNHDPDEFALCRRLAAEAAEIMKDVEVGMGSEDSDHFTPFFIVASAGAEEAQSIDIDSIRTAFGGTIYPQAEIIVEPLMEQGEWWRQVYQDPDEESDVSANTAALSLGAWRSLIQWFHAQPELRDASFVMIGEDPLSDENGGCVFPRLALGRTLAGSLVGLFGHVVHT